MSHVLAFFKKPFIRKYLNYIAIAFVAILFGMLSLSGSLKMGTQFLLEQIAM